jgi:hypothetical protein
MPHPITKRADRWCISRFLHGIVSGFDTDTSTNVSMIIIDAIMN